MINRFGSALSGALLLLTATTALAELAIEDPWVREAPPNAGVMAGYLVFTNKGDEEIVISGGQSEDFERVELHETHQREDGVATMRRINELRLAPGEQSTFRPGGQHLMLIAPRRELRAGDHVELSLQVDGDTTRVTLPVRKAGDEDHQRHRHH